MENKRGSVGCGKYSFVNSIDIVHGTARTVFYLKLEANSWCGWCILPCAPLIYPPLRSQQVGANVTGV